MPTPKQMIEDILNEEGTLYAYSDWEIEFIEQIETQLSEDWELSDKQHEMLEEIWRRV